VQQSGVSGALIERQERDVGDARESLESAPDLTTRVDAQGAGSDAVHHDPDGRGGRESSELGMLPHEATDAERVGRRDRDDRIRLLQRRDRGRVTARSGEVVGRFVVRVEGARHVDDGLLRPAAAGAQSGLQTTRSEFRPAPWPIDAAEDLDLACARREDRRQPRELG